MTIIDLDGMNTKRKLVDGIVDKVNGISLIMPLIEFQWPDLCRIINSNILVTLNFSALLIFEK